MNSQETTKKQDFKNGCIGCLTIFALLLLGMGACSILFPTEEQTSTEKLDEWFRGSSDRTFGDNNVYIDCEEKLRQEIMKKTNDNLLTRDEYEKIGGYNTSTPNAYEKVISWKFNAQIAEDGGYGDGFATCKASKAKEKKVSVSFKLL